MRHEPKATLFPYTTLFRSFAVELGDHDRPGREPAMDTTRELGWLRFDDTPAVRLGGRVVETRSEEHTSELQSRQYLVCRLLLEKKKSTKRSSAPLHVERIA